MKELLVLDEVPFLLKAGVYATSLAVKGLRLL